MEEAGYKLHFETRNALADLPWFDIHNDTLVLSDQSVGPVIDMHTHYALPTLPYLEPNIERETPDSNLLLGSCCSHHLNVYANECFNPEELASMKRDIAMGALTGKGKRSDHTAPNMMRDMKSMGVTHATVIGVDSPIPNRHADITLETAKSKPFFTGFGSINPRRIRAKVKWEEQLHNGSRGCKIHPPQQLIRADDPLAMRVYRWCGEVGIPVFWHTGPVGIEPLAMRYCGQMRFYEKPIKAFPNTTFILGHSGARQHLEAIRLQKQYKNTYLEISCVSLDQLREIINNADEDRIMFGSDWPFYHPVLPLAKVLIATQGRPAIRKKILYENAARLLSSLDSRFS